MPLGPFPNFDAAVRHFQSQGDSAEVARKKAGAMKKRIEGAEPMKDEEREAIRARMKRWHTS